MAQYTLSFKKFATWSAVLTALAGFLYSATFFWADNSDSVTPATLNYQMLMLVGLFGLVVVVNLYRRLRETEPGFALLAALLGAFASFGSLVHGAYALATTVTIPSVELEVNPIDPRGLLTFGLAGLSIFLWGYLMYRAKHTQQLWLLAKALGVVLLAVYVLRLLAPDSAYDLQKALGAIAGFVLAPAWYLMLAKEFASK